MTRPIHSGIRPKYFVVSFFLFLATVWSQACAGNATLVRTDTAVLGPGGLTGSINWYLPEAPGDQSLLDTWRLTVGPPVVAGRTTVAPPQATERLTLVSWNVATGAGDVVGLVHDLREANGADTPVVLLLQEVYREGPEVPRARGRGAIFPRLLRGLRLDGGRDEVETIAVALGMNLYYVPSMRNGAPDVSDEDRGNAILSTLPLTELSAIELPFERQRRVAVAATIAGTTAGGKPWRLRVVSAHLDNMVGARRLWIAGAEYARARQARGLLSAIAGEAPLVLGGDFNTWFGFSDQAYAETARAFPQTRVTDTRATFHGVLRLDHLFYRLPDGWSAAFARGEGRRGSDHYPLVAGITLPR